jgi:hypothetical protein
VNRYNGSVIVITVHLNIQKYSKAEKFSKKPERIVMQRFGNCYNVSAQSDPTTILSNPL